MNIVSAVHIICFVSASIYLLRMLSDGTRLQKQADFVYRLVFSFVFISLVINGFRNAGFPEIHEIEAKDYSGSAEVYRNELAAKAGENIADILYSQLKAAGISIDKIDAEVNISGDGSICINRIIISSADTESAAELIRRSLGQETEVINGMV